MFYKTLHFFKHIFYHTKYLIQKIVRKTHVSNRQVGNMNTDIARLLIPRLEQFLLAPKWTPGTEEFSIGEDTEKFCAILKELMESLKFMIGDGGTDATSKRYLKEIKASWGDWEAKIEKNKRLLVHLDLGASENGNRSVKFITGEDQVTETEELVLCKNYGPNWRDTEAYYYDEEMYNSHWKRSEEGHKLLGIYFAWLGW